MLLLVPEIALKYMCWNSLMCWQ